MSNQPPINQQEVPVELLLSIIAEQKIENRMLQSKLAQSSQIIEQLRSKESEKVKDDPKK